MAASHRGPRALAAIALASAVACAAPVRPGGRILVAAALAPIAEAARAVGGDAAEVVDLTPAGAEPHDFELRPRDYRLLKSADLIVYVGGGFQPALEDAVRGDRSRALDVGALDVDRQGPSMDPHVWLDPVAMEGITTAIAERFAGLRPAERPGFEERAARLRADLGRLDREFRAGLGNCRRRDLFTTHSAFGRLAARYGLRQVGISGVSPEAEPTPRRLREVAVLARESGATTIFSETLLGGRAAQTVARAIGAGVVALNPIESLTPEQRAAGDGYLSLMRADLRALALGLGCEAPGALTAGESAA